MAFNRDGYSEAVPLPVIVQFVPVFLVLFSTGTPQLELERLAGRKLWPLNLGSIGLATAIVGLSATAAASIQGVIGTLAWYAPPLTFVGMLGMGLVGSLFIDYRFAGVVALVPIIAPMTTNPRLLPLNEVWSFVAPGDGTGTRLWSVVGWIAIGVIARVVADSKMRPLGR